MSPELTGVLVGAFVASIMPALTLLIDHRHWRSDRRVAYLKEQRSRLQEFAARLAETLPTSMSENSYPIDLLSDLMHLVPASVLDAFNKMMTEPDQTPDMYSKHFLWIMSAVKAEIARLDEKIAAEFK